jgi:hypothetical protein
LNSIDLKGDPQKGDPQNPLHMEVDLTGPHCGLSPRGEPPTTRKRTCLLHEWRLHCGRVFYSVPSRLIGYRLITEVAVASREAIGYSSWRSGQVPAVYIAQKLSINMTTT